MNLRVRTLYASLRCLTSRSGLVLLVPTRERFSTSTRRKLYGQFLSGAETSARTANILYMLLAGIQVYEKHLCLFLYYIKFTRYMKRVIFISYFHYQRRSRAHRIEEGYNRENIHTQGRGRCVYCHINVQSYRRIRTVLSQRPKDHQSF